MTESERSPASPPAPPPSAAREKLIEALKPFIAVARVMDFYSPDAMPDMTFPRREFETKYHDEPRCASLTEKDFERLAFAATAFAASPPAPPSPTIFWVVERFENGKSQGYWDGGSSRYFVLDINEAVQFRRRQDAQNVIVGWHWKDVEITEHMMLPASAPSSPAGREEIARQIARKHFGAHAIGGSIFSDNATMDAIREATEALTKDIADALSAAPSSNGMREALEQSNSVNARLRNLVQCMLDNEPYDLISDGGHCVIDLWREDATRLLAAFPPAPASNVMREALSKILGQAHSGAMIGGEAAYKACLTIEVIASELLSALPPAPVGGETTCYIERSKVREIMIGVSDEFVAFTEVLLADIDALPIYTWPPAPTQSALKNTEKRLQKLESLGLDEAADFARLANEDKTPENPVVGSEQDPMGGKS